MEALLSPNEIINYLDQIIESLEEYEDCYEYIDISTRLREELIDTLQIELED